MSNYYYTDEEDRVIISEIAESPFNLAEAFRRASLQIGRAPKAVSMHWYKSLRHRTNCIFMTVSGKKCTVNGKNVVILENSTTTSTGSSIWNRIKRFLGL